MCELTAEDDQQNDKRGFQDGHFVNIVIDEYK